MADQNKRHAAVESFNEVLSPSQLFAARSRSHKIPVRGQKEFYPNQSEQQRRRLDQSLEEHWSLVSEERVERLGNLVKATWIPSEKIVELQSPAGKFWQTMGFSLDGKQCLLPEEALHLMECGNVQVFYRELPMSIQDGYEEFLSSDTVSLQQFQVFGHLKRLGYVVHRFDPRSEPSSYARQLNLPPSRDRGGRHLKRKRSPSPSFPITSSSSTCTVSSTSASSSSTSTSNTTSTSSPSEAREVNMQEEKSIGEDEEDQKHTESPGPSGTMTSSLSLADSDSGRTWWMTEEKPQAGADHRPGSGSSRWDFSSIFFPDVGSRDHRSSSLTPPDPDLLPGPLDVGVCDVAPWRRRINLRQVKMSAKEQRREEEKRRWRWDVNRDREVRRCRNWSEYRDLLERRERRRHGRPAHLWEREVTPLLDPTRHTPTAELLERISVSKRTNLLEGTSRLAAASSDPWRICFNVYQPDTVAEFRKSNPGKPYVRMSVCSFDGPVPDLRALKSLASQSGDVPVVVAVVDQGDISFYTFKDFQLPTDLYP